MVSPMKCRYCIVPSGTWVQPFSAMLTSRYMPSAVGYKNWMLVVGGDDERYVEILNIMSGQSFTVSKPWHTATSRSTVAFRPSLTVIEDPLYVVWECSAVSISIPMLILNAMSQSKAAPNSHPKCTEWQPLPDTPTKSPIIATLHGSLVALGGNPPSTTIAMYLPQTEQWVKVAELPSPRCAATCAILPKTEEMMFIGGRNDNGDYIKSIEFCTL